MAAGLKLRVVATLLFFLIYVDLFSFSVSSTTPPYKYFSTKTLYEWAHPAPKPVEDELYYLKGVKGKTCRAKYVSALNRHGARNPSLKEVTGISDLHRRLVAAMGPNTNRELRSWVNRFPNNNDQALTPLGETEQRGLGQRTGTKLRSLFAGKDNTDSGLKFLVTSHNRTKDSAVAFYEGLSSIVYGGEHNGSGVNAEVNNQLLRFYDDCDRYVTSVKDNKTAPKEYDDFLSSNRVLRIKEKIERKLNISSEVLTSDDVQRVNTFCGYDVAFFGWSPWCSLLDRCDMKIMEYGEDLEHYYETSYGHEINWQQSCQLVSAIFAALDNNTVDGDTLDK
ncbi:unnamed protein product [Candidula unifasciata]|uniref:Multiple inositol polyphosphate phosphatase 1 n=1 Tax=Candidula unifasciata TaxID=100452 RepID=A0A8S3YIP0_9EUPU|nr:unnamed protein product [Candidula unifasciata]